jgi:hypothetical protein
MLLGYCGQETFCERGRINHLLNCFVLRNPFNLIQIVKSKIFEPKIISNFIWILGSGPFPRPIVVYFYCRFLFAVWNNAFQFIARHASADEMPTISQMWFLSFRKLRTADRTLIKQATVLEVIIYIDSILSHFLNQFFMFLSFLLQKLFVCFLIVPLVQVIKVIRVHTIRVLLDIYHIICIVILILIIIVNIHWT